MNIIIAGDGEVGVHLAQSLTELDHNITVVDPHSELLKRLESETDLLTITGDSTSPQVLKEANVADCDLFLSVLHEESINLVTCILAKKLKAKKTVARITNAELLAPKHREMFFDFSGGLLTMYVVRIDEGSPVVGHDMKELAQEHLDLQVRVVAILRNGNTIIPHGDTIFQGGDLAYIIGRANQLENINRVVGKEAVSIRNTMIAGGGRIGRYAAMTLQDRMRITLIEENRQRAEELSALLDDTLAYVSNAKVQGKLKTIPQIAGYPYYLMNDGKVNGYPFYMSNAIPSNLGTGTAFSAAIFGNWSEVLVGSWGGLQLIVDPYTTKANGVLEISAAAYHDVLVRTPAAFCKIVDITTV